MGRFFSPLCALFIAAKRIFNEANVLTVGQKKGQEKSKPQHPCRVFLVHALWLKPSCPWTFLRTAHCIMTQTIDYESFTTSLCFYRQNRLGDNISKHHHMGSGRGRQNESSATAVQLEQHDGQDTKMGHSLSYDCCPTFLRRGKQNKSQALLYEWNSKTINKSQM